MPTTGTPRSPKKPDPKTAVKPAAKPTAASRVTKAQAAEAQARDGERITRILDLLDELYPDAHCELDFRNAYELLVAVILSAQCTDERVNKVTPALFVRYPDPAALLASDVAELEELIRSTGFFRNKAKNLRAAAKKIVEKFGGEVPRTMEDLLTLPGAARKTGNVVLGTAYGIPSGVVVDTHIGRLSQRLGMTREQDPVKIEKDLMELWPKERWIMSGHRLIWHGRRVCFARKPSCGTCTLAPHCPSAGHAIDVPSGSTPTRRAE
jgi:endonuclease-3